MVNFTDKKKCLNLGSKMPYLGVLGLEFQKNIFIFEMNSLDSASLQKFVEQRKCLNLGPKLTYLGILVRAF